jgi:putative FmdB family regulatory protein
MPIYEYQCTDCEHLFEEIQKIKSDPIKKCPVCGKEKVIRLISRSSFQLKGKCWAKDGYAGKMDNFNKAMSDV